MSVKEMYMGREMTGATTLAESVYEEMGGTTPLITESQTVKGAVNELKTIEGTKAYDNTATYAVGDYCIYNSIRYKCITAVTTAEDFDSTKWSATTTNNDITQLNSSKVKWKDMTFSVTVSSAQYYGYYYYDIPINSLQLPTGSVLLNVFIVSVGANYPCICQIVNNTHIRVNSVTSAVNNVNVTFRISYI